MRESKFGPGIGKWAEVNLGKNVDCDWHMNGNLDFYRTTEDIMDMVGKHCLATSQRVPLTTFYCSLRGTSTASQISHTRRVIFAKHKVLICLTLKGRVVFLIRPTLPADGHFGRVVPNRVETRT